MLQTEVYVESMSLFLSDNCKDPKGCEEKRLDGRRRGRSNNDGMFVGNTD